MSARRGGRCFERGFLRPAREGNRVAVKIDGRWAICNKKYSFSASAADAFCAVEGQIEVEGLGFFAEDALDKGSFEGHEAKEWAATVGIEMLEADIIRAVVAGLGVLMKKKQTGCGSKYGVDVLRIAFDALSKATRKLT